MSTLAAPAFRSALASAASWQAAMGAVLQALGKPHPAHNLGFVYVTDFHAADLSDIIIFLRQTTGIAHWVGTVGIGVVGSGAEFYDRPALSVLLAALPQDGFSIFADAQTLAPGGGVDSAAPVLIVHADPAVPDLQTILADLSRSSDGFLIGGLSASRGAELQVAGGVHSGTVSGVAIALEGQPLATGLSQGCAAIGPTRRVTRAIRNVILELDDRPALDVFREDIGPKLAEDMARLGGLILVGLVQEDVDRGEYLVRNLVGIDLEHKAIAIGDLVQDGQGLVFCKRDQAAAVADFRRMLKDLKRRAGGRVPKGGLYISCAARGPNQFAATTRETTLIAEEFGDMPLTGFFANGEISRDRLYGYTGILTLFL